MFNKNNMGFGVEGAPTSWADLDDINKALTATYGYEGAPTALAGGGVLQVESLDATMKSVTFQEEHLKLWQLIPKKRAFNTVEQINRSQSHGEMSEGLGFFNAENQSLPGEKDPIFSREVLRIRYMGDVRIVSHPATLVNTSGESMMAIQAREGTLNVLALLERALFRARGFHLGQADGVADGNIADINTGNMGFEGLEQQIRAGNSDTDAQYRGFEGYDGNISVVRDLVGAVADGDDLEEIGRICAENWGVPAAFFCPYKIHSDVSRQWMLKERISPLGVAGSAGYVLQSFFSSGGEYRIMGSRFLSPKRIPLAVAETSAPAMPVVGAIIAEADATGPLPAGNYSYRVSSINNSGESLACAQQVVALAGAERAVITINAGTVGAITYAIYRAPVGTVIGHEFVGFTSDSAAAGGGGVVARERGDRRPGLQTAYLMSMSERDVSFYQLAPLMKMDLALLSPAFRFMILLYGSPWVYAPKKHVILDNVGRS